MKIKMAQIIVERDIEKNMNKILTILEATEVNEWVIFPECALTGYFPEDPDFLKNVDPSDINNAVDEINSRVKRTKCYCLLGTALFIDGAWHNSVVILGHDSERQIYSKVGLSDLDKQHFNTGDVVSTYSMDGIKFGVQICRELLFPIAWSKLKEQGAQIIFHIDNAIKPYDDVWEHIVIARAVENTVFVCSVNNAAPPQELTSYLVDPSGKQVLRAQKQKEQILTSTINPENITNPY